MKGGEKKAESEGRPAKTNQQHERERAEDTERKRTRDRKWEQRERSKNRQEIQCGNRVKDNMERNMELQKQIN